MIIQLNDITIIVIGLCFMAWNFSKFGINWLLNNKNTERRKNG